MTSDFWHWFSMENTGPVCASMRVSATVRSNMALKRVTHIGRGLTGKGHSD